MKVRIPVNSFILLLSVLTVIVLIGAAWLAAALKSLPDVHFLSDPKTSFSITVRDWHGNGRPFTVGPKNPFWTPFEAIPENLRNAVMAGEDFSFYAHNGVDWFEVKESIIKNLEMGRFARGASTISQQLAKNLFLSRNKTVSRKIQELSLARRLEKTLTKDRILELYLNVVELGEMVYGVGQGSNYHFRKDTTEISLRESTVLAAMLPGPKVYNPERHMDRVMGRSDHILSVMLKGHMISEEEYLTALAEMPFIRDIQPSRDSDDEPYLEAEEKISVESTVSEIVQSSLFREKEPQPVPIPRPTRKEVGMRDNMSGNSDSGSTANPSSQ